MTGSGGERTARSACARAGVEAGLNSAGDNAKTVGIGGRDNEMAPMFSGLRSHVPGNPLGEKHAAIVSLPAIRGRRGSPRIRRFGPRALKSAPHYLAHESPSGVRLQVK